MPDPFWRIETGDCRDVMALMDAASVQTVVTSPPYFNLRDYGEEGQIGLEKTPEEYVGHLVDVFRAVRRVLRDDGTVWLNLGDSYNSSDTSARSGGDGGGFGKHDWMGGSEVRANAPGLKTKDLIGIPWRVAFALQAAGWYLRSEIVWSKPNGMPSSVTDRPTYSHEQVFLLTKSPNYSYDAYAIREEDSGHSSGNGFSGRQGGSERVGGRSGSEGTRAEWKPGGGRNKRSVWTVATVPYKDAHFATFPPKLVLPCVKAGSPEAGSCVECGAPRQRIIEKEQRYEGHMAKAGHSLEVIENSGKGSYPGGHTNLKAGPVVYIETLGWRPTCTCGAPGCLQPDDLDLIASPTGDGSKSDPSLEVGRAGYSRPRNEGEGRRTMTRYQQREYARQLRIYKRSGGGRPTSVTEDAWAHYLRTDAIGARPLPPELLKSMLADGTLEPVDPPKWELPSTRPAVVFDPFAGAGTTGLVALREGRSFIGAELSPKYAEQARNRLRDDAPLFNVPAESQ